MAKSIYSTGGNLAIAGAVSMIIGAVFWGASGTDLWDTLINKEMNAYLIQAAQVQTLLVVNTSFWVLGVLLMGSAITIMSEIPNNNRAMTIVALVCVRTAVPVAIVSFIAMLSIAVQIAPDASSGDIILASVVGWIGTRLDDLATMLIIGAGPLFLSIAGYGAWIPKWLRNWGYIAGFAGILALIAVFFTGTAPLGFVIIPVGIGWMIAAGVVARKHSDTA